jgi:crotonobetainyl-CoA:carnitine CoA-transferase CaiB-like acyl-CoA transferase
VLDLCDERGILCGKILGDMGADVIKIEKPGGDSTRNIGPFYGDIPHREKSLFWFAFNNNKRGITLNIESTEGKQIFCRLLEKADIVLESFHPGYLEKLGLGYEALKAINPRIIMTSITPFGQTGPYKDYKAPDIVVWAMGSLMSMCGDPPRPPVQCSLPQSYIAAATYAAEGTMVALYERGDSGLGQHVDVSAQATVAWHNHEQMPWWDLLGVDRSRGGANRPAASMRRSLLWECKDGYVSYLIYGGLPGAETNAKMAKWLEDEGFSNEYHSGRDWYQFNLGEMTPEQSEQFRQPIRSLLKTHTAMELFAEAVRRSISLFPVTTNRDIMENEQLQSRKFWAPIYHEELDTTIMYPGPFAVMSETPITVRRRAPLIGEHNREVYVEELGLTPEELVILQGIGAI